MVSSREQLVPDLEVRQALSTVQQYLSDTIAPLLAAESVVLLLNGPPQLIAEEMINWASAQYQGNEESASYSEYLYHAVKKLYDMGGLKLVSEERLKQYIEELKQLVVEFCPEEERDVLADELSRLGLSSTSLTPAVGFIHRPTDLVEAASVSKTRKETSPSDMGTIRRRLAILWKRLGEGEQESDSAPARGSGHGPVPGATPAPEKRERLVSQVVATAAKVAQNHDEFRQFQEKLGSFGIEAGTDQMFKVLSRSLPGWAVPITSGGAGGNTAGPGSAAIDAMRQIMMLAEDGFEGCKRFQEMINAAIEQFNAGSLARAATMFDLAGGLASEARLDKAAVASARRAAHESLDLGRLRAYAKVQEKHNLLRKVLNFFDEFKVEGLLDSLQREPKRDRRRLLLSLLETHGADARDAAYKRLRTLLGSTEISKDWYFPRNLVCLLNSIQRPDNLLPHEEIEMMRSIMKPSLPAPLVREAIADVGQIRHADAEMLLIETVETLSRLLHEPRAGGHDRTQLTSLLDRAIFALSHFGTPGATRAVVEHGLRRDDELGDTMARLTYLSGQDLSADEESCRLLLKALHRKMPRKVLGVTFQKNGQVLLPLIKALSATKAPAVQQALENLAGRFPAEDFGKAAGRALKEAATEERPAEVSAERLTGDLELFSLPDLLQQLALFQLTGTLTIKDAGGEPTSTISLVSGRMQNCTAGRLQGVNAVYQLLERPCAGTFAFQGRRGRPGQEPPADARLMDLTSVLFEGMRRYDEFQRASAVVPDSVVLKPKGTKPEPRQDELNVALFEQVWKSVAVGGTPEKCEVECMVDAYSVRTLLARWVEEDVLTVA